MKTGILVVNKAKDMTSHDVVAILRRKLSYKKIGHTGTLDPMATGLLAVCIGKATKVSDYIMDQGKEYLVEMKFGSSTTTYDSTGEIVCETENVIFSKEQILAALENFKGTISQQPPIYSALKVDGKKLYEYAREGKEVDIKSREVTIYDLQLVDLKEDKVTLSVSCSKGTYIRSLVHDLAIELGSLAHMTKLTRTRLGKFTLEDSLDIAEINSYSLEEITDKFISIEDSLYNLSSIYVEEDLKFRLMNGQKINTNKINKSGDYKENRDIKVFVLGEFLGIGKVTQGILKMEKLLCQE